MAKIEPKRFAVERCEGPVKVAEVALHQDIRSDRDGRSRQYIRVSGAAASELDDFDTITVHLEVEVYEADERLGTLSFGDLTIRSEDGTAAFGGEDALEVAVSATVTRIAVAIDATIVSRSAGKVELVPEA